MCKYRSFASLPYPPPGATLAEPSPCQQTDKKPLSRRFGTAVRYAGAHIHAHDAKEVFVSMPASPSDRTSDRPSDRPGGRRAERPRGRTGTTPPRVNDILDSLGAAIAAGDLPAGETFTLGDISSRWQTSRTVAREVMRALEQLGMVSAARRTGMTVLPQERWQVFHSKVISCRLQAEKSRAAQLSSLNQVRLGIEPIAARAAAEHATAAERAELIRLSNRLMSLAAHPSQRVGEELETDLEFHASVLRASHNEMFAALAPSLLAILKGKSIYGSRKRDPVAGTASVHAELARAIDKGACDAAEELARRILDTNRAGDS